MHISISYSSNMQQEEPREDTKGRQGELKRTNRSMAPRVNVDFGFLNRTNVFDLSAT